MSIYSGFATRQEQTQYNKVLAKLFLTLQTHILELAIAFNPKFSRKYFRLITKLEQHEQHKYLPPNFSQIFRPLLQAISKSGQEQFHLPSNTKHLNKQARAKTQLQLVKEEDNQQNERQWEKKDSEEKQLEHSLNKSLEAKKQRKRKGKDRRSHSVLSQGKKEGLGDHSSQQKLENRTFYYSGEQEPSKPIIKYIPITKSSTNNDIKQKPTSNSPLPVKFHNNLTFFRQKETFKTEVTQKKQKKLWPYANNKIKIKSVTKKQLVEQNSLNSSPNSIPCKNPQPNIYKSFSINRKM